VYLYGGESFDKLKDLWKYDTKNNEWYFLKDVNFGVD
jgi:hypothetical protein